jgi:hypothetical protein
MVKVFSTSNFLVTKNPFLFVAAYGDGINEPEKLSLEVASQVAINATTLVLDTDLTEPIWEGQKVTFMDGVVPKTVILTQDAAPGDGELQIKKVSTAIAGGATATPYLVYPVYGVTDFSRKGKQKNSSFEHWNSTDNEESIVLSRSWSYSMSSLLLINTENPGIDLIEEASLRTGSEATLYFEYHREDGGGFKGFANIEDPSESGKAKKETEFQYTFTGTGNLYRLNETIILA